jgi:hypothetical protein
MVAGDLITQKYQFEYNGLLMGAGTSYDIEKINNMTGHSTRSDTVSRFGSHGGVGGRQYADFKHFSIEGNYLATSDADFQSKRQALALAFAPIVDPADALPLCLMLPNPGALIVQMRVRCTDLQGDIDRQFALNYPKWKVFLEAVDPVLYNRVATSQAFTLPSDTRTISNGGNAPAKWTATMVGACSNPILVNNSTGQVISFYSLTIGSSDILTFDSGTSTVKLNGTPTSGSLQTGFSWWDMRPGTNSISVTASSVSGATFNLTTNDAYWIP